MKAPPRCAPQYPGCRSDHQVEIVLPHGGPGVDMHISRTFHVHFTYISHTFHVHLTKISSAIQRCTWRAPMYCRYSSFTSMSLSLVGYQRSSAKPFGMGLRGNEIEGGRGRSKEIPERLGGRLKEIKGDHRGLLAVTTPTQNST